MRAVLQRVAHAAVDVAGVGGDERVGEIGHGLLVLLGVAPGDGDPQLRWLVDKIVNLRIFEDGEGKMNHSVLDVGGGVLAVSQFTLYGDAKKGRRPSFVGAGHPDLARPLYDAFCDALGAAGVSRVGRGTFGAHMKVSLLNDGPVTLILDTP